MMLTKVICVDFLNVRVFKLAMCSSLKDKINLVKCCTVAMFAAIFQNTGSGGSTSCVRGSKLHSVRELSGGGGGVKQVQYVTGINQWASSITICTIRNLKQAARWELRTEPSDIRFIVLLNGRWDTFRHLKATPYRSPQQSKTLVLIIFLKRAAES